MNILDHTIFYSTTADTITKKKNIQVIKIDLFSPFCIMQPLLFNIILDKLQHNKFILNNFDYNYLILNHFDYIILTNNIILGILQISFHHRVIMSHHDLEKLRGEHGYHHSMSSSSSFRHSSCTTSTRGQDIELGIDILFDIFFYLELIAYIIRQEKNNNHNINNVEQTNRIDYSINIKKSQHSKIRLNSIKRRCISRQQKNKTANHGVKAEH